MTELPSSHCMTAVAPFSSDIDCTLPERSDQQAILTNTAGSSSTILQLLILNTKQSTALKLFRAPMKAVSNM